MARAANAHPIGLPACELNTEIFLYPIRNADPLSVVVLVVAQAYVRVVPVLQVRHIALTQAAHSEKLGHLLPCVRVDYPCRGVPPEFSLTRQ